MADNIQISLGTLDGAVVATDEIAGKHHQRVKLEFGADGSATDVSSTTPLPAVLPRGTTGTRSTSTTTTDAQVLAANTSRVRAVFYNAADKDFYLGEGTTTVTTSDFTVKLHPGAIYTVDDVAVAFRGLFESTVGSGALMVTEIT